LVNATYPKGDAGGNYEKVPSVNGISNLHAVWDSQIYQYPGYPVMPLSTTDWDWYTATGASYYAQYPVSQSSILSADYSAWALQSYDIAVNDVYPGFVANQTPSQQYQQNAIPILTQNMVLGAARLANLIEYIYSGNSLFLH
jgi:hypothetical protein